MLSNSKFHMWRTIFAMIHADKIVAEEELKFVREALNDINFSEEQRKTLEGDVLNPQNPIEMFRGITDPNDQKRFFSFAYDIIWVDGEYDHREFKVMNALQEEHNKNIGQQTQNIDFVDSETLSKDKDFAEKVNEFKKYF